MGRWPWLAAIGACGPLALLLLQCGGGDAPSAGDDIALPPRVDGGGSDDGSATADAPPSDASTFAPDAPRPRCDLTKPFGAPVRLADFDAKSARATPRLTPDELAIYFTTNGADAGSDLSMATRASTAAPFAGETILAQSTPSNDNDPMVSADQLSLWFHSNEPAPPTSSSRPAPPRARLSGPPPRSWGSICRPPTRTTLTSGARAASSGSSRTAPDPPGASTSTNRPARARSSPRLRASRSSAPRDRTGSRSRAKTDSPCSSPPIATAAPGRWTSGSRIAARRPRRSPHLRRSPSSTRRTSIRRDG
jgi:hypothetical protein